MASRQSGHPSLPSAWLSSPPPEIICNITNFVLNSGTYNLPARGDSFSDGPVRHFGRRVGDNPRSRAFPADAGEESKEILRITMLNSLSPKNTPGKSGTSKPWARHWVRPTRSGNFELGNHDGSDPSSRPLSAGRRSCLEGNIEPRQGELADLMQTINASTSSSSARRLLFCLKNRSNTRLKFKSDDF